MSYVDCFLLAVPKDRLDDYKTMAALGAELWMANGATSYVETIGDDTPYGELTSFPRAVQATPDELIVLAYITYPSREERDACNEKVMSDPRMKAAFAAMPFDGKRMIYGGFQAFLER